MIFQATCKLGVEALVATELRKLGIEPVSVDSAKIRFEGAGKDDKCGTRFILMKGTISRWHGRACGLGRRKECCLRWAGLRRIPSQTFLKG